MRWTLDYQPVKGSPWISLGIETRTTHDAWNYLTMLRLTTGLDYYAAQVYGVAS
jgi:hypothetical protein